MTLTQKRVLIIGWLGYAAFYLLRVNYAVAIPEIINTFGYTKTELGLAESVFFAMYAIGQVISGTIADRFGPKKIFLTGLGLSIVISVLFPSIVTIGLAWITLVWGIHGLFQSMGWSSTVKSTSIWFQETQKGRASSILGTSYIAGSALSWLLAGYLAEHYSWQYIFYGPTVLALMVFILHIFFNREHPDLQKRKQPIGQTLKNVLSQKRVWYAGIALSGLNIVRYGFITWAPTYYFDKGASIQMATYKALLFPLSGALGALLIGWLCDKYFPKNRMFVGIIAVMIMIVAMLVFPNVANSDAGILVLMIIGFTIFSAHVLLISQLPMLFGNAKNTATIVGIIDGLGYIGGSLTSVISGFLAQHVSWSATFYFWISGGVIAIIFLFLCHKAMQKNTAHIVQLAK